MLIILKGQCYSRNAIQPVISHTFLNAVRNTMWKQLLIRCAVLYPSELWVLILIEEGAWPGLHLGKSFPFHNGQRKTSLVLGVLLLKSFLWDWKPTLNSMESGFERGSELKINFIIHSLLTLIRLSHFWQTYGPLLSWKTFPSCDLLGHWMKPLRSKEEE